MRRAGLLTALLLAVCPLLAQQAGQPGAEAPATVRTLVETAHLDDLRWPDFSDYRKHLVNFYQPLEWQLAWTREGRVTPQARALITLFEHADAKGINAVDYDGSRWDARLRALERSAGEADLARFDVAVSISLMRYISDLHIGRINPRNIQFDLDIEQKKYYLPKLLTDIKESADPAAILATIEPPYPEYKRLQAALATYRRIAREAASEAPLPEQATVKAGEAYAHAPQLARMLQRVGDLPAGVTIDAKHLTYDGPSVDALKKFQARHGLEPTGTLGPKTLHQLNVPLGFRVKQIQWALERWRWAPTQFDAPPIVVNIPEFVLHAWDEGGKPALNMRVVVGKAFSHQTPVFAADMKYLVLRPYWNVPPSIQAKELVPKIEKNAGFLARNGYELVTPDGALVSGGSDKATLAKLRNNELQIRQKPGANNALGLVKFMFPNQNNVYLHSTPSQELFSRSRRDFSHGCIRVEFPVDLAAWVLRGQPEWTADKIRVSMHAEGEPTVVVMKRPVPIMIIYTTATVDENGELHFFEDIYGHDTTLENALAAGYPYPA